MAEETTADQAERLSLRMLEAASDSHPAVIIAAALALAASTCRNIGLPENRAVKLFSAFFQPTAGETH